ncbi:hypothetical protein [Pontibacter ummariensis]|nr:hypothetical protein [Pontibacter ummariensis]
MPDPAAYDNEWEKYNDGLKRVKFEELPPIFGGGKYDLKEEN